VLLNRHVGEVVPEARSHGELAGGIDGQDVDRVSSEKVA
jgi:hypothetical protein